MEQRDAERVDVSPLRGEVLVVQPVLVIELSKTGMQVETMVPLHVDALHEFRIAVAGHALVLKGRVAHSRISDVNRDVVTYLSGIAFVELTARVAATLDRYLEGITHLRGSIDRGDDHTR